MRKLRVLCLVMLLSLIPVSLLAFDLTQLRLNGFVSQGYMKTEDNNWLATDSVDGTTQIMEAGLTINVPVSDKLRVGMQFLSRDLGDEGNNDVRLDWAFGDYRFDDAFGVRLGKVKMPIGLYNEGRDSDFLRNMAFLPQSVYDETRRNLLVASQGGQIYGNLSLGAAGDLDYAVYGGQINFPDDSPTLQAFLGFAQMGDVMTGGSDVLASISADNEYVYGGRLMYNTVVDGLRIGASVFEGKADFPIMATNGNMHNLQVRLEKMYVGSFEYATPQFTFAGEYIQFEQPAEYDGMAIAPVLQGDAGDSGGYYAMLSVPMPGQENLVFTLLYDAYYRDLDDKDGTDQEFAMSFSPFQMPAHYFYREDFGVGFRLDISEYWLIKAEWHQIEGADLLTNYFNDGPGAFVTEKDWDYYIVKTSFNF